MLPIRSLSSACQRPRFVVAEPNSLKWRKNRLCVQVADPSSNFRTPLALSHGRLMYHPEATRRISNYRGANNIFEDEDDLDEEEEDSSLDLLVQFVQTMLKKISRRARKAARSILPSAISPQLVGFSVNGLTTLTFLWMVKAFLQVVCTLGSIVFVAILLLRGVWSAIAYIKINGKTNDGSWNGAQPAT